ncbi:protein containing DUF1853, partial [sediment metagenome]
RTLGEYDFLFRDASTVVCHWEAAVKFYLQAEPLAEQRAFIGPGTRDRLDLKLNRVFQHQLLLGSTQAGQLALPTGIQVDKAQAFIKGYLFNHASGLRPAPVSGVSATHLTGWWVRHQCEKLPQASADSRWIILPRLRWLAPARLPGSADVMNDEALASRLDEHFQLHGEALLLVELALTTAGEWQEVTRGFVVCSTWPTLGNIQNSSASR